MFLLYRRHIFTGTIIGPANKIRIVFHSSEYPGVITAKCFTPPATGIITVAVIITAVITAIISSKIVSATAE